MSADFSIGNLCAKGRTPHSYDRRLAMWLIYAVITIYCGVDKKKDFSTNIAYHSRITHMLLPYKSGGILMTFKLRAKRLQSFPKWVKFHHLHIESCNHEWHIICYFHGYASYQCHSADHCSREHSHTRFRLCMFLRFDTRLLRSGC